MTYEECVAAALAKETLVFLPDGKQYFTGRYRKTLSHSHREKEYEARDELGGLTWYPFTFPKNWARVDPQFPIDEQVQ